MPRRKLSAADIAEIVRLRTEGLTLREIAERFGVHNSWIGWICIREGVPKPPVPEASRAKIAAAARARRHSDQTRARISASQKARHAGAWEPPAAHLHYFRKLLRNGIGRAAARAAIEALS